MIVCKLIERRAKFFFLQELSFSHNGCLCTDFKISLTIPQGNVLAVLGSNGSGKTTLFETVAGLHNEYDGQWGWINDGQKDALKPGEFAYLRQKNTIHRSFPINVKDFVLTGRKSSRWIHNRLDDCDLAKDALGQVGLESVCQMPIHSLSYGQFQRMLWARIIIQDCPLILLDEPFSGIDELAKHHLILMIQKWAQEGKTILLAEHDKKMVLENFPYTLLFNKCSYFFGKSDKVLLQNDIDMGQCYHGPNLF